MALKTTSQHKKTPLISPFCSVTMTYPHFITMAPAWMSSQKEKQYVFWHFHYHHCICFRVFFKIALDLYMLGVFSILKSNPVFGCWSKLLAVFNISFEMMFAKLWEDIFPLLLSVHRHVSAGKALLQWQSAGNKIKR